MLEEEGHPRELHPLLATPVSTISKEVCLEVKDQGNGGLNLSFYVLIHESSYVLLRESLSLRHASEGRG